VRGRENAKAGLARLRAIYEISVSTGGVVAKRKTWKIELRLRSGALRRALWVDRDSGLLMKRETYRDDGSLARRERIVKLAMPASVDPASLKPDPSAGPWVPDGFVFTGESGGVRRWSNGLESYEVRTVGGKAIVSGDLAEDDAARVLESASK
ncbi:MAG: sigma-E factor regulatory protein RseB domain-containing protein, partial [Elusimicrobia bacterium]|nr:sigma-E factor regulatory protein RseB domain-containing protein [Elusimicrobiota bacterium]